MSPELPPTRHGRSPYEIVSGLQKACRRSQPEQAAGFAIELAQAGHGSWAFSRMKVIAVEDCSPTASGLVADIAALAEQWKQSKNRTEGGDLLAVVRAAVALALAPKSRIIDWLVVLHGAADATPVELPDEAYDMHTWRGREMGRGRKHFAEEASRLLPFESDLAALEAEVRERALAGWLADDDDAANEPANPWHPRSRKSRDVPTPESRSAPTSSEPAIGQLRIEPEDR